MSIRPVKRFIQSEPTIKGAGMHLQQAFEELQQGTFLKQ